MSERDFLQNHVIVDTRDVNELKQVLVKSHGAKSVVGGDGPSPFSAKISSFQFPTASLAYCSHSGDVKIEFSDDSHHRFQFALVGSGRASGNHAPLDINPGAIVSAPGHTTFSFAGLVKQFVLRTDKIQIKKDLAHLLGATPRHCISFAPTISIADSHAGLLRETILHSASIVDGASATIPAPLLKEIEQTIRMAVLFGMPNNFSDLIHGAPASVSLGRVKRIEEWIDANWRESITLEKLVEVSGVSGRSIFMAFKKERGYSPMAYVKTVRLNAARNMLLAATPDATVTGIGYSCHFMNMSRFADDYRLQFNELPSKTLQRSKLKAGIGF